MLTAAPAAAPAKKEEEDQVELPPFKHLPMVLVFPNLHILVFWGFNGGLCKTATGVLVKQATHREWYEPKCGAGCTLLASATLLAVFMVMVTTFAILAHFAIVHRKAVWRPARKSEKPTDVYDPALRAWSQLKLRLSRLPLFSACCAARLRRPTDRMAGKWAKPPSELEEPARTERLLAEPFRLRRGDHASDTLDMLSLTCFPKTSGGRLLGLFYAWTSMLVQLLLGILAGLGPFLVGAGWPADAQTGTIAAIKLGWCLVLLTMQPCSDSVINGVVSFQFFAEGVATLILLLVQSTNDTLENAGEQVAFVMMVVPVLAPVAQKTYDAVIVTIIVQCCRKRLDWAALVQEGCILLLALPSMVAKTLGGLFDCACEGSSDLNLFTKLGTTVRSLTNDRFKMKKARKTTVSVAEVRQRQASMQDGRKLKRSKEDNKTQAMREEEVETGDFDGGGVGDDDGGGDD